MMEKFVIASTIELNALEHFIIENRLNLFYGIIVSVALGFIFLFLDNEGNRNE